MVRHHARGDRPARHARPRDPGPCRVPARVLSRIVELGPGNGTKLRTLIETRRRRLAAAGSIAISHLHLIDVSGKALDQAAQALAVLDDVEVVKHQTTYESGLGEVAATTGVRTLVLFLGSNIGNFDRPGAEAFLRIDSRRAPARRRPSPRRRSRQARGGAAPRLRRSARRHRGLQPEPAGAHQPGAGRRLRPPGVRPPSCLEPGRIAGGDASVSRRRQRVRVASAHIEMEMDKGDTIWTESSYKYRARRPGDAPRAHRVSSHRALDRRRGALRADAGPGRLSGRQVDARRKLRVPFILSLSLFLLSHNL